jgi:type II secretory pathway pseudopilin PulG
MSSSGRSGERGHLMVALMAAVAILLILSLVAEQAWQDVRRRDLEAEMVFRAQDIVRALKIYRQEHGQLPLELKAMMEPGQGGRYCLRKLWKDPLVKDGKWGLLFATPQGTVYDPSAPPETQGTGTGLGGLGTSLQNPGFGQTQQQQQQQQQGLGQRPEGGAFGNSLAASGGDVTGLPIAGVKSLCTKKPFRILNEQTEYARWYFTVFDQAQAQMGAAVSTLPSAGGSPGSGGAVVNKPGGR